MPCEDSTRYTVWRVSAPISTFSSRRTRADSASSISAARCTTRRMSAVFVSPRTSFPARSRQAGARTGLPVVSSTKTRSSGGCAMRPIAGSTKAPSGSTSHGTQFHRSLTFDDWYFPSRVPARRPLLSRGVRQVRAEPLARDSPIHSCSCQHRHPSFEMVSLGSLIDAFAIAVTPYHVGRMVGGVLPGSTS